MLAMRFSLVWIAALSILAALIGVVVEASPAQKGMKELYSFNDVEIAIIGSSLSKSAFAPTGSGAESVLADGRSHRRYGISNPSPELLEDMLELAVDDRVQTVLLEARPFVFLTNSQISCGGLACDFFGMLPNVFSLRWGFRERYRQLAGLPDVPNNFESGVLEYQRIDAPHQPRKNLGALYPLTFPGKAPSARLAMLVKRAKENGTQIILMMPPRSMTASEYIGEEQIQELRQESARFADALGLDLFMPLGEWEDDLFVDTAHLRRGGRNRLQAELQSWWRELP